MASGAGPARASLALAALLLALGLAAAPARAVELEGAWYVLVHYTDASSAHPERVHWRDRLWTFEREGEGEGERLVWTDHPIVVFDDQSGRWEGRRRALGGWEPSASQRGEIERGLRVNSRGRKQETLTGSDAEGWSSDGGGRRMSNAFTYEETWSVEELEALPVFTITDTLEGTSTMEGASGATRYVAEAIEADGDRIVGRFERDGSREGTFRMIRAGAPRGLPEKEKTPNERAADRARERMRERAQERDAEESDEPDSMR